MYHLRITTDLNVDVIQSIANKISGKYIIGQEEGHYHIVYDGIVLMERKQIRELLNSYGIKGNKGFSLTEARTPKKLVSYVCKDGNIIYKGYSEKEISIFKKLSFKKNGFDKELVNLEEKYVSGDLCDRQFGGEYIGLLADYDKNIYKNQISAYLQKMRIKKNRRDCFEIYDEFFSCY